MMYRSLSCELVSIAVFAQAVIHESLLGLVHVQRLWKGKRNIYDVCHYVKATLYLFTYKIGDN